MDFRNHFIETSKFPFAANKSHRTRWDHKVAMWNTFIESELMDINEDDCAIFPRILPLSYLKEIEKCCYYLTKTLMKLLYLPENEIRAIFPEGPVRDFLIHELKVIKYRPKRICGSFRYDMAIVGEPVAGNTPKLLEVNEIGFDGLARSSYLQKTLLELLPELKEKTLCLDTARAEINNMKRLGNSMARLQDDCYNWDEEYLLRIAAAMNFDLRLVSPDIFRRRIDSEFPLLKREKIRYSGGRAIIGRDFSPDALQLSFAFNLAEYKKGKELYSQIVREKTPHYGPFLTGLVAAKTILVVLQDRTLLKKLMGTDRHIQNAILEAKLANTTVTDHKNWVLKHTDGYGGEMVFMDKELLQTIKKVPPRQLSHWVYQKRVNLNVLKVQGIISRPRKVISDIGVFVHYDWDGNDFKHFEVGGFITRATNRSFKVNVSGGGIQVPVFFDKNK